MKGKLMVSVDEVVYQLSKADIKAFKESFQYWMSFFSLSDQWDVQFKIMEVEHEEDSYMSAVVCNEVQRMVCLLIPTSWYGIEVTRAALDKTAFHEVLHVLLSHVDPEMSHVGPQHMVINLLETTVYPKVRRKFKKS